MTKEHEKLISVFANDIIKLNRQRIYWLIFSSVIFIGVILVIAFSSAINSLNSEVVWWAIGSVGFIVTINWWYWTLILIRRVLTHQIDMVLLLDEITKDVNDIKVDIFELFRKGLIK
jgi:hypothetical protein